MANPGAFARDVVERAVVTLGRFDFSCGKRVRVFERDTAGAR